MGVTIAVTRAAATVDTAPYTQDITTVDLGGLTPKAALLVVTRAITDGTAADHYVFSYGAATGASNEWVISGSDEHNLGTTENHFEWADDACIQILDPTDGSEDGSAEFSSFIANGVRINWTNAPAGAYLITAVFFAGTDLLAHANNIGIGNAADLETNCEQPGFEPDVLFTAHQRYAAGSGTTNNLFQTGLVHWDGDSTVSQRAFNGWVRNAQATTDTRAQARNDIGIEHWNDWWGDFLNFDASGFSMITRNAGGNNSFLQYLALSFGGVVDAAVGTHTTPTSTGNNAETGPGFTPQFVLMFPSLCEVMGTEYNDNRGGSYGISVFDDDDEYCITISSEDSVGTSNTQSLSDDRAIVVPDDDGALDIEAAFVSFDATGWTVNYTNAPATAKVFPYLAIEAEAAGVDITVPVASLSLTGYAPTVAVTENITVAVPAASLSLTGYTPTVVATANINIDVPLATLSLTGYAPTVVASNHINIDVPVGSISLIGYAPTIAISDNQTVDVPLATLNLTGYVSTVTITENVNIAVPIASLVLTGLVPTVIATANIFIDVPAASLTLTGYTPTIVISDNKNIEIPAASLSLTTYTPTVAVTNNINIEIPIASLTLTGYVSVIDASAGANVNIDVPVASLILTSFVPIIGISDNINIVIPLAALELVGYAPELLIYKGIVGLTLSSRPNSLALYDRQRALTLKNRSIDLTLEEI